MNETEIASPWLDKEFIESALRSRPAAATLVVDDIELTVAVGKGVNYASELQRVAVDCHDDATSYRRHLIVKSLPTAEFVRELLTDCGTFERESRMYEKTLPDLRRILGERLGDFAAVSYTSTRPRTIIMDDLSAEGYRMVTRRSDGLDFAHCKLALLALARLHAASVIYSNRRPDVLDEYTEKFYTQEFLHATSAIYEPMFTKLISVIATWPGYESYIPKLQQSLTISNIIDLLKLRPDETIVLTHGDPWLNNFLFHYNSEDVVDAFKIVDFQEVRFGSPALDVLYFFSTNPSQEVRETSWDELLAIYHAEYCDILRVNDEEALILDDMATVEALRRKMDEKSLFGLMAASATLPLVFLDGDTALDVEGVGQRGGDGDENMFEVGNMFVSSEYIAVFKKLLAHYEKEVFSRWVK